MKRIGLILCYLAAIVGANLSVTHFGPQAAIYNAFAFIGFALVLRDALDDLWGSNRFLKMLALIAAGTALTYAINRSGGPIALAGAAAFLASETVDYAVYRLFSYAPWLTRSNASNIPSALVDSIVFPTLAFGSFSAAVTFGQFSAKVAGGLLFSLVLARWRKTSTVAGDRFYPDGTFPARDLVTVQGRMYGTDDVGRPTLIGGQA